MIDDEERAALERELAAELDALDLEEESDDYGHVSESPVFETTGVVSRDLEELLRQVGQQQEKQDENSSGRQSAWELLIQSVDRSDREFFGALTAEIDDIRATILLSEGDTEELNKPVKEGAVNQDGDHDSELQADVPALDQPEAVDREQQLDTETKSSMKSDDDEFEAALAPIPDSPDQTSALEGDQPHQSVSIDTTSTVNDNPPVSKSSPLSISTPPKQPATDPTTSQHDSTAWSRIAQQRWEKQQQEAATWLSQLEMDVERLNDEQERLEHERSEAKERSRMLQEELLTRQQMERQRELLSQELMQVQDAMSRLVNEHWRCEQHCERAARSEMGKEDDASDAAERWRVQQAISQRHQHEKDLMRRLFNSVLQSLIEKLRVKQAEQLRRLELERRRETRENSLMRAEEAQTRRLTAQTRAVELEHERWSNRLAMAVEDELATERERVERRDRAAEVRSCQEMRDQELYSVQAWAFELEDAVRRQQAKRRCMERADGILRAIQRRLQVRYAIERWLERTREAQEREKQAIKLQRWWRRRLEDTRQPETVEDLEEWSDGAQDAAMMVQSAFRGFFVRRRFQAALDLARQVGDQGDEVYFDEVNLDELIELPPELADGWEDPVLPRVCKRIPVVQVEVEPSGGDTSGDEEDRDEQDTREPYRDNNNTEVVAAPVVKEPNIAASLWSKMMRSKQKQKRGVEERAKQPKRGGGKAPRQVVGASVSTGPGSATPTISWTTSSNPPKPKVKLPSLVERLRKKTAAER